MATTTIVIHGDVPKNVPDKEKHGRIVRFIARNMTDTYRCNDRSVALPERTISNPSPVKKSASNRHHGQTETRTEVGDAIAQELAKARLVVHDLADHVLGHIVSTTLARDILQKFVEEGFVCVYKTTDKCQDDPLAPTPQEVNAAIEEAFEAAQYYECSRLNTDDGESETSSTDKQERGKNGEKKYSFRWKSFPTSDPLREDELVSFLNDVTDCAFKIAGPELAKTYHSKLRHRFAAPTDKHHAVPLSYETDGEDMRPDFLLLPIEAFMESNAVNPNYINFTAARLVGESKNKDIAAGIAQMHRYARGMKRAQPWLYYVLGLAVTKDKAVFLRGEGSGTEQVHLSLSDGRGCVEFIRIVLGLALADHEDLGHNPDVVLEGTQASCKAQNVTWRSNTASRYRGESKTSFSELTKEKPNSSTVRQKEISSMSTKRSYSEVADDNDEAGPSKKRKPARNPVERERFVFVPIKVYGHRCLGILFTASSIRGRGTTVFCVVNLKDDHKLDDEDDLEDRDSPGHKAKRLALRTAWQDLAREEEQNAVMERLRQKPRHPNVIVPFETFKAERNGKTCTTLDAIRDFLGDQIEEFGVENRVLTISKSELKRPVQYFWGVHDFLRGLRGALLGHEYLTSIGILHRDISENNIVLGLRPEDERGYLIDFDMAILQDREEPTEFTPICRQPLTFGSSNKSVSLSRPIDSTKPTKALRTGTFPYISQNVLCGGRHTQFDDVESFLYVLFLFFFSYAGPLSASDLEVADETGFVQSIGAGRPSHMRSWPKRYADWADGDAKGIGQNKRGIISSLKGTKELTEDPEFIHCLQNNWPEELHEPISQLIENSFALFHYSSLPTQSKESRSEVSHEEFITILDDWLEAFAGLEDKFSNCPFKEARGACASVPERIHFLTLAHLVLTIKAAQKL